MLESYSQDDAQEILQLAIARQANMAELSRPQLLEIATELGISSDELHLAEQAWRDRQEEQQEQNEFKRIRRSRLQQHCIKYTIINIFLVGLDWISTGSATWSLYVVLGWGLALSLDTWKTLHTDSEAYEREFQRWRRQRQFRQSFGSLLDRLINPQTDSNSGLS